MNPFGLLVLLVLGSHAEQAKVFSIADLHGDYEQFKLIIAGLGLATFAGDEVHWTGGNSILVSTGDTVDRGEHSRPIYLAFQMLAKQAPKHGGEVINILGNHELMNLQGDLRYVHPEELAPHGDYGGERMRASEWGPNGRIGRDLRARYVAAAVRNGTLFVHGGLDPDILSAYGSGLKALDSLNARVTQLINSGVKDHKLFGDKGPLWNRLLATAHEQEACQMVERTLSLLGVDRMVVGHTPQRTGVNVRCEGPMGPRIILGDTFISKVFGMSGGIASAVELDGSDVTAIYFVEGQEGAQRVALVQDISV